MLLALPGTHALTEVVPSCCQLQLAFDDTSLTVYGRVTLTTPRGAFTRSEQAGRDALRELIGHHVTSVDYSARNYLRLRFTNGVSMNVSLRGSK
jgi:hypothetical protein